MKRKLFFVIMTSLFLFSGCGSSNEDLVKYVNPFIGTGGDGNTYPGAQLPFGMVQLSPDTRSEGMVSCGGYKYADSSIIGFSHTHLNGVGEPEFLDILFMPTVGKVNINAGSIENTVSGYRSRFSHDSEKASPGYYSVMLDDYDTKVELIATERCGFHKYTFPKSENSHIIIDLAHAGGVEELYLKKVSDNEIEGLRRSHGWAYNQYVYFVAKFSKPFQKFNIAIDNKIKEGVSEVSGKNIKAIISYATDKNESILVKVGISAVSINGARKNLEAEIEDWNFNEIKNQAAKKWNQELSKIQIEGGTEEQRTIFYTAMYHVSINPILFMDVDSNYRGIDQKIHTAKGFTNYSVFSLWDTFRGYHPLMTIINQNRTNDFIRSLIAKYDDGGRLPMWALAGNYTDDMLGFHVTSVIADAYIKGIRDYDTKKAYDAMKELLQMDRLGLKYYKQIGYLPYDRQPESVSKTLEYCYNDWCISQMAKGLGSNKDFQLYNERALFYENVFDTTRKFMRGKSLDRKWLVPFNPLENSAYSEGNAYQYMFVPHDTEGLIKLMGGDKEFEKWLDVLFTLKTKNSHVGQEGVIGQYWHGNEPGHHLPYLYNYVGKPWKTQEVVNKILTELNYNSPDGIAGNDDCGQMSAWYILSSLGFYSVSPGQDIYVFGSPLFNKVTINLENGKKFVIEAKNISKQNYYLQSVELNGETYSKSYIKHNDIMNGGNLVFEMGSKPNYEWGSAKEDRPYSLNSTLVTPRPYLKTGKTLFENSTKIELGCDINNCKIYYTLDGTEPTTTSKLYDSPIIVTETTNIKFMAYQQELLKSGTVEVKLNRVKLNKATENIEVTNGLNYSYYEKFFVTTSDLDSIKPLSSGIKKTFNITNAKKNKYFGFKFQGYIKVPDDEIYTFYLESNDGSRLFIDGKELIENDANHGSITEIGSIGLKSGLHEIEVKYFQCGGGKTLKVSWDSPNFKKREIKENELFRKK